MTGSPAVGAGNISNGIFPANGGVLIAHRYSGASNAHDTGTVVAVGNGVPWLTKGQKVCFKRNVATEFEIDLNTSSIDFSGIPLLTAGNVPEGTARTWLVLVDQRDISATLDGDVTPFYHPQDTRQVPG